VDGLVYLHPANGGGRTRVEGAILKSMGVVPGAPDLLLWHQGRSFALELKSESGKLSKDQAAMLERLAKAGVVTEVAYGLDEAIKTLEGWRLLNGRAYTKERQLRQHADQSSDVIVLIEGYDRNAVAAVAEQFPAIVKSLVQIDLFHLAQVANAEDASISAQLDPIMQIAG
jgi:hypothetical protein